MQAVQTALVVVVGLLVVLELVSWLITSRSEPPSGEV